MNAQLTLNAFLNSMWHPPSTSWGLSYRFNGGAVRPRMLTALEVQSLNTAGAAGNVALVIDVPLEDLVAGTNTLEFLPIGAPMDVAPAIANIDLLVGLAAGLCLCRFPPPTSESFDEPVRRARGAILSLSR